MKKILAMLAAVAFVAAFTAPAFSAGAEWSFYGNSRIATWWDDKDFGDGVGPSGDDKDEDLTWNQQSNSRIGALIKYGDISAQFEYGTGVNRRILWGEWNFGAGELGLGWGYTPLAFFYSSQAYGADAGLLDSGGVYGGRRAMIQLTMGSFEIALIEPNTPDLTGFAGADTDTSFPKIEAEYTFSMGGVQLKAGGGYQTYDVVDAADNDEGVDSWVAALGAKIGLGGFDIWGNVYIAENQGNYGHSFGSQSSSSLAAWDGTDVVDNESFGFIVGATFKMNDMLTFEAGYGYTESELDQSGSNADDKETYYVQANISLAKGVFIVPEIGFVDNKDDAAGNDEGDTTYFGAKWQISW